MRACTAHSQLLAQWAKLSVLRASKFHKINFFTEKFISQSFKWPKFYVFYVLNVATLMFQELQMAKMYLNSRCQLNFFMRLNGVRLPSVHAGFLIGNLPFRLEVKLCSLWVE